jgi:hypothetical protein
MDITSMKFGIYLGGLTIRCSRPRGMRDLAAMEPVRGF